MALQENLVYKWNFEVLQPVKKESREDGEAGLCGEPEIDFRIQDVQYFFFIKYGFKNWRFDSYKSSEGFEYLFYSITIIMSHSHVPRRHAIVQICLVSFQLKIHN